ncbi:hypothetical protein LD39_10855, partial [Halobacillus sp. BBL2006]
LQAAPKFIIRIVQLPEMLEPLQCTLVMQGTAPIWIEMAMELAVKIDGLKNTIIKDIMIKVFKRF